MKKRILITLRTVPAIFLLGLIWQTFFTDKDWRTASRESAGIAPNPLQNSEAIVQVYGADAWSWRGLFAIHTWISVKRTGHEFYSVYDVVGWRSYRGESVMKISKDIPDRYWYGSKPRILIEHRGSAAEKLIDQIDTAAQSYPWKDTYSVFPGPNSNTFIAWIAKNVPDLQLDLPFSAIGKNYVE